MDCFVRKRKKVYAKHVAAFASSAYLEDNKKVVKDEVFCVTKECSCFFQANRT